MKTILKSKKGEVAYIFLCVLIIFISVLLSILILYMSLVAQIQIQKRDLKAKLDGYVSEYVIEMFSAIKHAGQYDGYVDYDTFRDDCYAALGFDEVDNTYIYDNGNCVLSDPSITVLRGNGFGLSMQYKAAFHINWNGMSYSDLIIPITIYSYYRIK